MLVDCAGVGSAMSATQIIRQHSRSFALASRLLPQRVRGDVVALYAWCRTADDSVDGEGDVEHARTQLMLLKSDVLAIAAGKPPEMPASSWLTPLILQGLVNPKQAIELLEGMELDCQGFHPSNDAELNRYCYHAAGTVGLMMAQLMGAREFAASEPAVSLGMAMQLTNIARDVREDAQRGRSYLPGIREPLNRDEASVPRAVAMLLQRAELLYATAAAGIAYLPSDCRMAVRVALAVYREIGREIVRQGYPVLQRRVVLSRSRLCLATAQAILLPHRIHRIAGPSLETHVAIR